ncbi:putative oxalocrotonate tautomerase [Mycena albidolilacea]|uniref:Oxalocrotonate tautomerase n=1 Tax=Mycena albidolilacea TaxID=1033008 RepID=A0AAD6ZPH5_9AGAR|nr:putative oxalocrotonate tautomerase [Mycena albidolilacea]
MPLHRIFVPTGLYTPSDKAALAQAITDVYAAVGLPPFYVVVLFIDLEPGNFFVGGKATERMVRISVEHIARNFKDDTLKRNFMDRYETALAPFTKVRGLDWEVQVTDCDRLLWNLNGMAPPEENSEEGKMWKQENRAVSPEEMEALKARS